MSNRRFRDTKTDNSLTVFIKKIDNTCKDNYQQTKDVSMKRNFKKYWPYALSLFIGIGLALISNYARAEVLFEGYSKITSGGVSIGYSIQKYEFLKKKNQYVFYSYLKTNSLGGEVTESTKAIADKDFKPISYQYTSVTGGKKKSVKTIDGKVSKNKLTAKVVENGKSVNVSKDLPAGTFFSSFLAYVILKSPSGLSPNTNYDYIAITEEDGDLMKGSAVVKEKENYKGIETLKVINDIREPESKKQKFLVNLTPKGEMLITKVPELALTVELVTDPSEATQKFGRSSAVLSAFFGGVPTGKKNTLAESTKKTTNKNPTTTKDSTTKVGTTNSEVTDSNTDTSGIEESATSTTEPTPNQPGPNMKGYGVKPGQGMHLKGGK